MSRALTSEHTLTRVPNGSDLSLANFFKLPIHCEFIRLASIINIDLQFVPAAWLRKTEQNCRRSQLSSRISPRHDSTSSTKLNWLQKPKKQPPCTEKQITALYPATRGSPPRAGPPRPGAPLSSFLSSTGSPVTRNFQTRGPLQAPPLVRLR